MKKSDLPVAVIGGGYAGMAAAVELAAAGRRVHVFEAGPVLGGRARRVTVEGPHGEPIDLDNGQHMLVGAYRELLRIARIVGIDEASTLVRLGLDLDVRDGPQRTFRLACPRLPAPWHSLIGLLRAEGLSWHERWAAIRVMSKARLTGWRLSQDMPVAQWLQCEQQPVKLTRCLWEPLTLAALNTPIASASAQVLLNVLRDSLAADRAASDFLLPSTDLSAVFPDAAGRYVEGNGGEVHLGAMVRKIEKRAEGWHLGRSGHIYEQVIVALPPHRLAMLAEGVDALASVTQAMADWTYQPIYTVYLGYPKGTRLPKPMLGLVRTSTQWLFDRGVLCGQDGIVSAIISAEGPHTGMGQAGLVQLVMREAAAACPSLPAPIWQKVIAEKRATFACTPGLQRPGNATTDPTLWLAGDYTAGDYPATLEGAVRSGVTAARGALASA